MKRNKLILVILAIVLLCFLTIASFTYMLSLEKHAAESVKIRLEEITQTNVVSFNLQIDEQVKKVTTLADYIAHDDTLGGENHVALLQAAVKNYGLLRCALFFRDGSFITHDLQNEGNVSDKDFFLEAVKGNISITDPMPAVVDETKTVILFTSPIVKDGQVVAGVTCSYLCDDLDLLLNLSFMDGTGNIIVAKENGDMLIGEAPSMPARSNIIQYFTSVCMHTEHKAKECSVIEGETGTFAVQRKAEKESLFVSYNKLPFNDWYMFSIVSKEAATKTISSISNEQRNLGVLIFVSVFIYVMFALSLWIYTRNNVDKLSGAPTYEKFKRVAKKLIKNNPSQRFVVVKLDVRNFKLINRMYNFDEGNRVIKSISLALKKTLTVENAIYARVGIDDFIILLPYMDRNTLAKKRERFITYFHELMGEKFSTNVDFPTGQYITTEQDAIKLDIMELFEKVNFAHRTAKRSLGTAIVDYEKTIESDALFQKEIEDKMDEALTNEEFSLFLQPKYNTITEKLCGVEALVRWVINERTIMYPTDFVPVFENNGFIVKIDMYMFRKSVILLRELMDDGQEPPVISVNFSRNHLHNERFVEELCRIADEYNVPHKYLEVELTETVVYENVNYMIRILEELHANDFTLSLDDFGSGYSSLGLLKDLKVDVLKIDRSFLGEFFNSNRAQIVVSNIIRMAKELNIVTVAEGVETVEVVNVLREMGCDMIQGYYYCKPIAARELLPIKKTL